jgi:hypothetical protein
VISWGTIGYGAGLTALFCAAALLLIGERRPTVVCVAVAAAFIAPIGWNAVLRATHAREFFTDAPISVLPASWQDTGSGVVTLAVSSVALALVSPGEPLRRAILRTALVCALVAFLVDVYLY